MLSLKQVMGRPGVYKSSTNVISGRYRLIWDGIKFSYAYVDEPTVGLFRHYEFMLQHGWDTVQDREFSFGHLGSIWVLTDEPITKYIPTYKEPKSRTEMAIEYFQGILDDSSSLDDPMTFDEVIDREGVYYPFAVQSVGMRFYSSGTGRFFAVKLVDNKIQRAEITPDAMMYDWLTTQLYFCLSGDDFQSSQPKYVDFAYMQANYGKYRTDDRGWKGFQLISDATGVHVYDYENKNRYCHEAKLSQYDYNQHTWYKVS